MAGPALIQTPEPAHLLWWANAILSQASRATLQQLHALGQI